MYRKVLVGAEIEAGERVLKELASVQVPVEAAFWLYAEEAYEWRLIIVSPAVGERGPRALYELLRLTLAKPDSQISIPFERIYLVSPNDLRYHHVRLALGLAAGMHAALAPRNVAGEDVYVYQMAA